MANSACLARMPAERHPYHVTRGPAPQIVSGTPDGLCMTRFDRIRVAPKQELTTAGSMTWILPLPLSLRIQEIRGKVKVTIIFLFALFHVQDRSLQPFSPLPPLPETIALIFRVVLEGTDPILKPSDEPRLLLDWFVERIPTRNDGVQGFAFHGLLFHAGLAGDSKLPADHLDVRQNIAFLASPKIGVGHTKVS